MLMVFLRVSHFLASGKAIFLIALGRLILIGFHFSPAYRNSFNILIEWPTDDELCELLYL